MLYKILKDAFQNTQRILSKILKNVFEDTLYNII